ncbi:bile acid:sodium symporter [Apibacter muscae]|uniref:Bile acid:sodium symporter n=1 Tax=Apibacter muscae TaxID=2509004 RepID=A0A563DGY9_9FLAO|nr:bile acid:sodium symporter family protein [Apibacter muscae]TWP29094.1 bile acid:sodium symporter [Apibacter muscae]TWP30325.1 bile acid:sodium symporter [Apibacter muscae]
MKTLKKIGIDEFLILLLLMIILAYFFPSLGSSEGTFSLKSLTNIGVSVIFLFYGLRLSLSDLKAGLSNWKLHILIHLFTFIVFPLLILPLRGLFTGAENQQLWLGIFYLAALPSTVSSSVVMVSIAKGNIPAAIFNASISSLLGVFVTPLWVGLVISGQNNSPALGHVMIQLVIQVIIPVIIGIILNKYLGEFAKKYNKGLKKFDQAIILSIVYTAFCESFTQHAFDGFSITKLVLCGAGMVVLFFIAYYLITLLSRLLNFNREDKITATFCGSKKSLVHGTVMSKVLFPNSMSLGVILLPTMLYHALQLIVVSIIAQKLAKQVKDKSKLNY